LVVNFYKNKNIQQVKFFRIFPKIKQAISSHNSFVKEKLLALVAQLSKLRALSHPMETSN